jgi:hypothetical protein
MKQYNSWENVVKIVTRKSFISAGAIFNLVFGLHSNIGNTANWRSVKQKGIDDHNLNKYPKSGKQSTIEHTYLTQINAQI